MEDENKYTPTSSAGNDESESMAESNNESEYKLLNFFQGTDSKLIQGIERTYAVVNSIYSAYSKLVAAAQRYYGEYKPVVDEIRQLADSFARAIEEWNNSTYTEERRQRLIESHKKWGEYGWTLPPNTPYNSFDTTPKNIDEANNLMMKYCTENDVEQLFIKMRGQKLKQEDLEEAIGCYNNRHYKACALILFDLMDAGLITRQADTKRRPVGKKAATTLRTVFDEGNENRILYTIYRGENLFSYLEILFADGKDFQAEPPTINRNYVSHGMTHRPVRQHDCIQLFLALYNLIAILEMLDKRSL